MTDEGLTPEDVRGLTPEDVRATLESVAPMKCEHCGAPGTITPEALRLAVQMHRDGANASVVRAALLAGTVDNGWGAAGMDEAGNHLVVCPDCATTGEVATARSFFAQIGGLGEGLSPDPYGGDAGGH